MQYKKTERAKFIERLNRFEAYVEINGKKELVHVKNTGRCKEILLPGSTVILSRADNPNRKTAYDLVAVYKEKTGLINMDSQAPNQVVKEWLQTKDYDFIKPEYKYGKSRIDFYMEKREGEKVRKILMEVKGCTLEYDGVGYFPDAPTERGVKHLQELTNAIDLGYECVVAFVIQMEGVTQVFPERNIHPEFGTAVDEARKKGVQFIGYCCHVEEDSLTIEKECNLIM